MIEDSGHCSAASCRSPLLSNRLHFPSLAHPKLSEASKHGYWIPSHIQINHSFTGEKRKAFSVYIIFQPMLASLVPETHWELPLRDNLWSIFRYRREIHEDHHPKSPVWTTFLLNTLHPRLPCTRNDLPDASRLLLPTLWALLKSIPFINWLQHNRGHRPRQPGFQPWPITYVLGDLR